MSAQKPTCQECAKLQRRVKKLERLITCYLTETYGEAWKTPDATGMLNHTAFKDILDEAQRIQRRSK